MPELAPPSSKLVLIVDDDALVLDLLQTYVSLEGFQVVTAENGRDAMDKIRAKAPDLIITDLRMPKEGGYELLRSLQASGNGRIPVIVVTASKLDQSTIEMIRGEGNVVEFVVKPIPRALFIKTMHRHLKTAPKADDADRRGINDER